MRKPSKKSIEIRNFILENIGNHPRDITRLVSDHFDISYELEHQISGTDKEAYLRCIREVINQCTFSYTRQIEMKGLGHAI